MPIYLYASIGALVFAIVHGMHFSVSPLPKETGAYINQIAVSVPIERRTEKWTHPDIRIAAIGF